MGETFCCCCSLRTGTLVYGYFRILFSTYLLITVIAIDGKKTSLYQMLATIPSMVILVLLIYGAAKEKKHFVLLFIVWDAIILIFSTVIVIFLGYYVGPEMLIGLPIIAIYVYLWCNVLFYFNQLSLKERHGNQDVERRLFDETPAYEDK